MKKNWMRRLTLWALAAVITGGGILLSCSNSSDSDDDNKANTVKKEVTDSWGFADLKNTEIQATKTQYATAAELAAASTDFTTFGATSGKFSLKNDVTYASSRLTMTIKALGADGNTPIYYNTYSATSAKDALEGSSAGCIDIADDAFAISKVTGPFTVTVKYSANSSANKTDGRYLYVKINGKEYVDATWYNSVNVETGKREFPAAGSTLTATYSGTDSVPVIIGQSGGYGRIYDVIITHTAEVSADEEIITNLSIADAVGTAYSDAPAVIVPDDVDMDALQAKLDQWDAENTQEPYIVATATGGVSGQTWTLTYGAAAGEKAGTVITIPSAYNANNGFDVLNYAISMLPAKRTTKAKLLVDSDLYSGEPSDAKASAIKQIAYLYAIAVQSYTIVDFNGHTLYADNSDASAIVPLSLYGVTDVSIRNLEIKGQARYAIWAQGVTNAVFDTITLTMDSSSGLGLRIADRGTSNWSKNIYVDNIKATGCQDNAVETMKVDSIWIGTVYAKDCNDCGLLLNTTTNAVVGKVTGIRCSPRSGSGVYAAMRCANYVGPNVHIHEIIAEDCGHGFFSVSANHGITIDKLTSTNSYAQAILIQDTQNLLIKSGTLTGGSHNSSKAVEFASGSGGGALTLMNNTFMNMTITGYSSAFNDHAKGIADYNNFINVTTSGKYTLYGTHNSVNTQTAAKSGDFQYTVNDKKVLTAVSGSGSVAVIPDGVLAIGDSAFRGCSTLTAVTIPNSVQIIGHAVFYGCTALASVEIPASVTEIGDNAFYGCTSLAALTLNEGLVTLNNCVFGLTPLTTVTIPSTVKYFGHNLFYETMKTVNINSTAIVSMGVEAFFNIYGSYNDQSTIHFANSSLASSNIYQVVDKNASFGSWGAFWYGYTRSTVN